MWLCTKGAHFTFSGETFTKTDRMAMGSPLGSVSTGIFMVELETFNSKIKILFTMLLMLS